MNRKQDKGGEFNYIDLENNRDRYARALPSTVGSRNDGMISAKY